MLDFRLNSYGDNFFYLKEDIKVGINFFKLFVVREMMGLLVSKQYLGRFFNQVEEEVRCGIWKERNGGLKRKINYGWIFWYMCLSVVLDYSEFRLFY